MNDKFIDTSATLHFEWKDDLLKWRPELNNGIEQISVSADEIWTPDMGLLLSPKPDLLTYNSIMKHAEMNGSVNVIVRFDGLGIEHGFHFTHESLSYMALIGFTDYHL